MNSGINPVFFSDEHRLCQHHCWDYDNRISSIDTVVCRLCRFCFPTETFIISQIPEQRMGIGYKEVAATKRA
jgi:hypothetical protein